MSQLTRPIVTKVNCFLNLKRPNQHSLVLSNAEALNFETFSHLISACVDFIEIYRSHIADQNYATDNPKPFDYFCIYIFLCDNFIHSNLFLANNFFSLVFAH